MVRPRPLLIGFFGFVVVSTVLELLSIQRTIIYSPRKYTAKEEEAALKRYELAPSACVDIVATDKTRLRAYWLPAPPAAVSTAPTVLYLHVRVRQSPCYVLVGQHGQNRMGFECEPELATSRSSQLFGA